MVIGALIYKIGADIADLVKNSDQVNAQLSKLNETAKSHTTSFTTMTESWVAGQLTLDALRGAVSGVTTFLKDSVAEYAASEQASARLTAAMRAQGSATGGTIASFDALAEKYRQITVYDDDVIKGAMAIGVQVGNVLPSQMEGLLTASTNLAAGLGMDLAEATTVVAKAMAGNTTALAKLSPAIRDLGVEGKNATAILEALNSAFGGQAAAQVDTYAGRVAQLGNSWGEVKKAIGEALATDADVQAFMEHMKTGADSAAESIKTMGVRWNLGEILKGGLGAALPGGLLGGVGDYMMATGAAAQEKAHPDKFGEADIWKSVMTQSAAWTADLAMEARLAAKAYDEFCEKVVTLDGLHKGLTSAATAGLAGWAAKGKEVEESYTRMLAAIDKFHGIAPPGEISLPDLYKTQGLNETGRAWLPTDPYDIKTAAIEKERTERIRALDEQRRQAGGLMSPQEYQTARELIDQDAQQKLNQAFDDFQAGLMKGSASAAGLSSGLDQATASIAKYAGASQAGGGWAGSGFLGAYANGGAPPASGMSAMDLMRYNTSLDMALYGKGLPPELAALIFGPTVFPDGTVRKFATGGYAARPTLAIVGDSPGGEYMVPAGKMGGHTVIQVTINAQGASFDTPQSRTALANEVAAALEARLRAQGKRL